MSRHKFAASLLFTSQARLALFAIALCACGHTRLNHRGHLQAFETLTEPGPCRCVGCPCVGFVLKHLDKTERSS